MRIVKNIEFMDEDDGVKAIKIYYTYNGEDRYAYILLTWGHTFEDVIKAFQEFNMEALDEYEKSPHGEALVF